MTFRLPLSPRTFSLIAAFAVAACGSSDEPSKKPGSTNPAAHATSATDARVVAVLGANDEAVTFTEVRKFGAVMEPIDLAFHPSKPDEMWVVGIGDDSVQVGQDLFGASPKWKRYRDPNSMHFMHRPPALAMGAKGTFGTCGDNDNSQAGYGDGSSPLFMGPALFSLDLTIFATEPTPLGSHLDMLHHSPFCRGIAHVQANEYWVFNSYDKSLDRVNFNKDHGPGNDDHSDGEIYQYVVGGVLGAEDGTPSHLYFDAASSFLYVADTGHSRVVRLDTRVGERVKALPREMEPLKASGVMAGGQLEVVVPAGVLEKPSGIEVRDDVIYVTDTATSTFHAFSKDGKALRKLETFLPAGSLAGFTFDKDGKIWFTDRLDARVVRIDTK